jgi:hypothetical protein
MRTWIWIALFALGIAAVSWAGLVQDSVDISVSRP